MESERGRIDALPESNEGGGAGRATVAPSPSGQARPGDEPAQNASGLLSSESVLDILALILAGAPLAEVLTIIARLVEARANGMLCAIFLLDENGRHVRCVAAPSLPEFTSRMRRLPVGLAGASSGAAVYRREPVYSTDILSDPIWDHHRHLLVPYGIRAVWARPLLSRRGKVLGTFASYYREVRSPSTTDVQLIENASHIVGIAIERHMNEEELRRSEAFLAEAQRLSSTGSFAWRVATDEITWSPPRLGVVSPCALADRSPDTCQ